jgi:ribonuclease VapC
VSSVVLDASALLAVLQGERGSEQVLPKLKDSSISAVNYSEVLKKLIERGEDIGIAVHNVESMRIVVKDFDKEHARLTAELWPSARKHGLSLGDRACLALGQMLNAEVLTTDKQMAETQLPVKVKLLRDRN